MPEALNATELTAALAALRGWSGDSDGLLRAWRFSSFAQAMAFMHDCAPGIDALGHHPDWSNVYDRVSIRLTTHDAGNRVTVRDVELAALLDAQAQIHGGH
jgi:4a-hydroxytetrahydrobiopterin dehydratase